MEQIVVGIVSLGCAKNLVDTEVMLGLLKEEGYRITGFPGESDVIIVNTCGFINQAKEESIDTILEMAGYKETGRCRALIVTGCLGQRYHRELLAEIPEIDAVIGTGEWHRIAGVIKEVLDKKARPVMVTTPASLYDHHHPRILTTPRHSVYVKIAEGCDNRCSYCVIPLVRGRYRSRKTESVVAEAQTLAALGVKEINLIAQDTTSYGKDLYPEPQLVNLLAELAKIDGIAWLRLLYCYPTQFDDVLIDLIAREPKICKYIDLPLQHASDEILRRMNRRGTQAEIRGLLAKIRERIPGVTLRSSFIVGFPGETEAHFAELLAFIKEMRFDRLGVFAYSREENTPAAALPDQVPEEVKQARLEQVMTLQAQISHAQNALWVGKTITVLVESPADNTGVAAGRSERDAPDVDGKVLIEGATGCLPGKMVRVKITRAQTYDLVGRYVETIG